MSEQSKVHKDLSILLEKAYGIIYKRNMYGLKRKIPRGSSAEFMEMVRQRIDPGVYNNWNKELGEIFRKYGLQTGKFRARADSYDPDTDSDEPAQIFLRRVREVEQMVEKKDHILIYVSLSSLAPVYYKQGRISQGATEHGFRKTEYRKLLRLLWSNRRIAASNESVLVQGKSMPRKKILFELNVDSKTLNTIIRGIKSSAKKKDIKLTIKYPDGVILVATQDTHG